MIHCVVVQVLSSSVALQKLNFVFVLHEKFYIETRFYMAGKNGGVCIIFCFWLTENCYSAIKSEHLIIFVKFRIYHLLQDGLDNNESEMYNFRVIQFSISPCMHDVQSTTIFFRKTCYEKKLLHSKIDGKKT